MYNLLHPPLFRDTTFNSKPARANHSIHTTAHKPPTFKSTQARHSHWCHTCVYTMLTTSIHHPSERHPTRTTRSHKRRTTPPHSRWIRSAVTKPIWGGGFLASTPPQKKPLSAVARTHLAHSHTQHYSIYMKSLHSVLRGRPVSSVSNVKRLNIVKRNAVDCGCAPVLMCSRLWPTAGYEIICTGYIVARSIVQTGRSQFAHKVFQSKKLVSVCV